MEVLISTIVSYVQAMAVSQPKLLSVIVVAYVVGVVIKVLRSSIEQVVAATETKADDEAVAKAEANPIVKGVLFLADVLIRLKKPAI